MWQVVFAHISVEGRVVDSNVDGFLHGSENAFVNNPTLNRNVGKYNLPHIWDKVLSATQELKI